MTRLALLAISLFGASRIHAQPEGYFTSEAATVAVGNQVMVSIKKYNPSTEEISNAASPKKNAPMGYLQVPFVATAISINGKLFESKLYCLDREGKQLWEKTIGHSNSSVASPLATDSQFVYTGEGMKEADKVQIVKYDQTGKQLWQLSIDSVEQLLDIRCSKGKLVALVAFESKRKVKDKGGSYSIQGYPVYHFVNIDPATGTLISKQYQMMGNYLSSIGYKDVQLNSYRSYYVHNRDSAIFLSVEKQDGATVVSQDKPAAQKIVAFGTGYDSNHLLAEQTKKGGNLYTLYYNDYTKNINYQSPLEISIGPSQFMRYYLHALDGDALLTVIGHNEQLSICQTDAKGKSSCRQMPNPSGTFVSALGTWNGKPYIIAVPGREVAGSTGRLKLFFL